MSRDDVNFPKWIYPFSILNKVRLLGGYLNNEMGFIREIYKIKLVTYVHQIFNYETLLYRIFATIEFLVNFSVYICFCNRKDNYV